MTTCKSVVIAFICFIAVVSTTSSPPPTTDPEWPPNYPSSAELQRNPHYENANLDQRFVCTNDWVKGKRFNLAYPADCSSDLSPDTYGWGVRVGYYTTWFSSVIANMFLREEILGALAANFIFLFALEFALFKATFLDRDAVFRVDAIILYLIGVGTTVGALSLWGYRTRLPRSSQHRRDSFGGIGTFFRIVLSFLFNVNAMWFWKKPFKNDPDRNNSHFGAATWDPRCWTTKIFGHNTGSSIKWLFFIFALLWNIYLGISFLVWSLTLNLTSQAGEHLCILDLLLAKVLLPRRTSRQQRRSTIREWLSPAWSTKSDSQLRPAWYSWVLPMACVLWFAFIMAVTEKSLRENHIGGVYVSSPASSTSSQLIPFLIGVLSCGRLAWMCAKNWYKDYRERKASVDQSQSSKLNSSPAETDKLINGRQTITADAKRPQKQFQSWRTR